MKLIATLLTLTFMTFKIFLNVTQGQAQVNISIDREAKLNSIFPIDNIIKIRITNIYGKHTLTDKELFSLKEQLKKAKFAGGLLIKPGHIILEIKLKDNRIIKPGFVYASVGQIHFDNGIDKFNEKFSGTFILPGQLNFDNYK